MICMTLDTIGYPIKLSLLGEIRASAFREDILLSCKITCTKSWGAAGKKDHHVPWLPKRIWTFGFNNFETGITRKLIRGRGLRKITVGLKKLFWIVRSVRINYLFIIDPIWINMSLTETEKYSFMGLLCMNISVRNYQAIHS
jgi:hypothetical protein